VACPQTQSLHYRDRRFACRGDRTCNNHGAEFCLGERRGYVSNAAQTVYERRTHTNPEMSFSCSIARDGFNGIRKGMRHRETIPKSLGVATVHLQHLTG
jgi:hypothetical protein